MKFFFCFVCVFLLFGCNPKESGTDVMAREEHQDPNKITAKDIEMLNVTEYVLSSAARDAVSEWQRYRELMVQMEYLKKADLAFFDGKNELLIGFLNDLKKDTPKNLDIPAVKERLIVLETKILKFHGTLKLQRRNKNEILGNIKEILVALSNLQLQINKKFEFESQTIIHP